jgi:gamma-glutamyltranspeptidase/glutathione hydrolase
MPDRRRQAVLFLAFFVAALLCANASTAATGQHAAVAAEHQLASQAGLEILRAGGNAVDAAAAAVLASGVVNPASSGIGGGGFMVIFDAKESRAHTVDFRETAPRAASAAMYVHDGKVDAAASKRGGTAVATPGEVAGLAFALQRFGTKSLAEVAAPAIRLARDGFVLEDHLAAMIAAFKTSIAADPGLAAVFLHPDGSPFKSGDVLRRPDLARTLEAIAAKGSGAFYDGEIAADIINTVARSGGFLAREDLAQYRPVLRPPVVVTYGSWRILGMPPPSSGGGLIGESLKVLAPFRPADLGQNSPTYLHVLAETLKGTFADRAAWYGDPDRVRVPLERLLSENHAARIRSHISAAHATPASVYGSEATAADAGTAHISVVDERGNAVACTSSVNTPFGALLSVLGRDIVLNDTMDDFTAQPGVANAYGLVGSEANAIAPLKRPLSSMSPTIVLDGESVRLVLGASGGPRIISATLQVLLDVLTFAMNAEQAVAAPRIHHQWMPDVLLVEDGVPETTRAALARRGHEIRPLEHGAAVQAVEVTRDSEGGRLLRAASDARKGGVAAAY